MAFLSPANEINMPFFDPGSFFSQLLEVSKTFDVLKFSARSSCRTPFIEGPDLNVDDGRQSAEWQLDGGLPGDVP